jgi:hypothetical protein
VQQNRPTLPAQQNRSTPPVQRNRLTLPAQRRPVEKTLSPHQKKGAGEGNDEEMTLLRQINEHLALVIKFLRKAINMMSGP